MKFLINNNTTYNYSYYATRPKWLVEALVKESLSLTETNSLCLRKSFPTHKIAFAQKSCQGSVVFSPKVSLDQGVKEQFLTESRLNANDFRAVFTLPQTKNQATAAKKLKREVPAAGPKIIKASPQKAYQHLFQTKELLCWTSDLSFFNLRGYFSNILKVLQICRFAVRNNKKILFIKGSSSSYGQGKLLNPWLVQYERNTVPQTLSDLFNKSYLNPAQSLLSPQILSLKKNKGKNQKKNDSGKILNVVKHSLPLQEVSREAHAPPYHKRYYQLSGLLNYCLNLNFGEHMGNNKTSHFKNPLIFAPSTFALQETPLKPWGPTFFPKEPQRITKSGQKKNPPLLGPNLKNQNDESQDPLLNNGKNFDKPPKKVKIKINNIIKLWIKEAQTMSQQTAAGLTIPLAGFLTNSKTTFNTICNLSNYDFYNSVNSNLKPNSLFSKGVCKIKTNRLEKVNFQKRPRLLSQPSEFDQKAAPAFTTTGVTSKDGLKSGDSVKSLRYLINQEQIGKGHVENSGAKAFNFPTVFESSKLTATKGVKQGNNKQFIEYENTNWWIDYSNNHYYLPLTPDTRGKVFFKESESITHNARAKKHKPLEYCFFGDVFTWQSKSQKRSSLFYSNTLFSKNKDNTVSYLKKQLILEKRGPIVLKKKKKAPFFTYFKKQLQMFKNRALKYSQGPVTFVTHGRGSKEQKKGFFLKKRQFLSTLAKFIVFYLNDRNIPLKNQTKQANVNKAYIYLPSFPTIKTKVKITLNSRNIHKYDYKPAYRYNLALHTPKTTSQQDTIKTLQSRGLAKGSEFFRAFAPWSKETCRVKTLKKTLPQKKQRLRTLLFYRYYKTIIALNYLNQYKMFAKTPFVNNQLADIIFFINPEKNQNLVNQANSLKIPTVGIISGNVASSQGHQGYNNFRLKESVYYPILGNPTSSFFTRAIISLIVKFLRVEKSKNQLIK